MSSATANAPAQSKRILSMDQFRGFAILGMLMVDYFDLYNEKMIDPKAWTGIWSPVALVWEQIHHVSGYGFHFADLVAPIFMFVVGMGMRLSMLRRIEKVGLKEARRGLLKRYGILILIGFTIYTGYLWDALLNIALAGFLVLWVVERKPWQRLAFGCVLVSLYQFFFVTTSYGDLVMRTIHYGRNGVAMPFIWKFIPIGTTLVDCPINGGPIGHWSWALILIAGTIAYDILHSRDAVKISLFFLGWGVAFLVIGWLFQSIGHWQNHPDMSGFPTQDRWLKVWAISKSWTTISYAFWSAGWCFLVLLLFYYLCDIWGMKIPTLSVVGMNPLVVYVIQWCICESAHRFIHNDQAFTQNWWFIWIGWGVVYGLCCYGTARYLYEKNIYVKV